MIHVSTVLFLALGLFMMGCSSDKAINVPDDWPGIDDIRIVNENNSIQSLTSGTAFDLSSKISLPKMGTDVSYKISSECNRKTPLDSGVKKTYNKEVSYTVSSQNTASVDVLDHLADEVLIYPDFFEECSFKLSAVNQNKSTDSSVLKNLKLAHNDESYKIKIDFLEATEKFVLSRNNGNALRLNDLENITMESFDGELIKNSRLLCHSKNITSTLQVNEASERKILYGDVLNLPSPVLNQPVEHCVVHAKIAKGKNKGKTITSTRMSFLNSSTLSSTILTLEDDISSGLTQLSQLPYEKNDNNVTKDLFTIKIDNQSFNTIEYELDRLNDIKNISVVEGLEQVNRTFDQQKRTVHKDFSMMLKDLPASYKWSSDSIDNITKKMIIKPFESAYMTLSLTANFLCENRENSNESFYNEELGFFTELSADSDLLKMAQVTENSFIKQVITSGNHLALSDLKLNSHLSLPVAVKEVLPEYMTFKYFFRNSQSVNGLPLFLNFVEPASSVAVNNIAEPTMEMFDNVVTYNFQSKAYSSGWDRCSSTESQ